MNAKRIEDLKAAADEAGTLLLVAICQLALQGRVDLDTYEALSSSEREDLRERYGVGTGGTTHLADADLRAARDCERALAENA